MFSRKNRRPKTPELLNAWQALDEGDVPGALRQLRQGTDDLPLDELALVVARAAGSAGFDDLRTAADSLAARPEKAQALYDFGYACIERGVPYLAIPALRLALRQAQGSAAVLRELVSAYEREGRHRDAVEVLTAHESGLVDWPDRYLLVYNALMAGDLAVARRRHARLPDPQDAMWLPAQARQRRMLERAGRTEPVSPLDATDLRGWQYVIGGTVLGTLSPYGFESGMTGRFAWLQDTHGQCLRGLLRLKAVLGAAGVRPTSVSLLPERGSRILGLAAAEVLELPAKPFAPDREDTVVVAYDLNVVADAEQGPEILGRLLERTPGQVLHEHASSWTDPPVVTADSVTLLHQSATAPWEGQLRAGEDGNVDRGAPDGRPEEDIAADILAADASPDEGDGGAPADPVEKLTDFVSAVRDTWLTGDRAGLNSTGPVSSSRFR
ncbi:tetratricopeptide repeat protein [Streptomyces sp. NPDC089424]|uniref:tetratricopeptide repeat protein n=1 Tax=Streptomyces sp. NPDC089424 TaxID=3365917 RepID=UPI00381AE0D9